mmetsp:Transcript_17615/g.50115  ORF Transcript_17615/g.50115 Transcript_17615/m.50115 type:complete len:246 (+) Transcript_17615:1723-2460(+)
MVHGLPSHAARDRAVADDGDAVTLFTQSVFRRFETDGRADRRRRVAGAESVIVGLFAFGESGEATSLPQGVNIFAPTGEDLMRLALVRDVPTDLVVGGVINMVQRNREFDDAEAGAQVSAGHRHGVQHLPSNFFREVFQLLDGHRSDRRRACVADGVQQGRRSLGKMPLVRNLTGPLHQTLLVLRHLCSWRCCHHCTSDHVRGAFPVGNNGAASTFGALAAHSSASVCSQSGDSNGGHHSEGNAA